MFKIYKRRTNPQTRQEKNSRRKLELVARHLKRPLQTMLASKKISREGGYLLKQRYYNGERNSDEIIHLQKVHLPQGEYVSLNHKKILKKIKKKFNEICFKEKNHKYFLLIILFLETYFN